MKIVGTVKVVTGGPRIGKIVAAYRAAFDRQDWAACWDLAEQAVREWTWRGRQTHILHEGGEVDPRTGELLGTGTQFCYKQREAWLKVREGLRARFPAEDEFIF